MKAINDIMNNELFKASEMVIEFLSSTDRTIFDNKKKQFKHKRYSFPRNKYLAFKNRN